MSFLTSTGTLYLVGEMTLFFRTRFGAKDYAKAADDKLINQYCGVASAKRFAMFVDEFAGHPRLERIIE
jgi:hypothetical protein